MKTISQLREHFFLSGRAYWDLYAGHKKDASRLIEKNLKESRLEQSFDILEKFIELNRNNNDSFFIVLKRTETESSGTGNVNLDFEKETTLKSNNSNSIGGLNTLLEKNNEVKALIGQLAEERKLREKEQLERKHEWEIFKLQMQKDKQIESLEATIEALKEESKQKKDPVSEQIGAMLPSFIAKIAGFDIPTQQTAKVGYADIEKKEVTTEDVPSHDEQEEDIDLLGVNFNSVIASVAIIKNYIPDAEVLLHNLSVNLDEGTEQERLVIIQGLYQFLGQ